MTIKAPQRRIPRQGRGERRITAILDAAEQVIADVGYEAATTNAIAARAGASIGSLYQYFPHKEAIIRALAERYQAELHDVFDSVFALDIVTLPLPQLLDRLIDPVVAFYDTHCGFKTLFTTGGAPQSALPPSEDLDREMVSRLAAVLSARNSRLDESSCLLYATMCKQIGAALLSLMDTSNLATPEVIIAETKRVLAAYLERVLNPSQAG